MGCYSLRSLDKLDKAEREEAKAIIEVQSSGSFGVIN
jgi:hypothetical protein